jgi:hypothetical protein
VGDPRFSSMALGRSQYEIGPFSPLSQIFKGPWWGLQGDRAACIFQVSHPPQVILQIGKPSPRKEDVSQDHQFISELVSVALSAPCDQTKEKHLALLGPLEAPLPVCGEGL